jgi:hypothetical protein
MNGSCDNVLRENDGFVNEFMNTFVDEWLDFASR